MNPEDNEHDFSKEANPENNIEKENVTQPATESSPEVPEENNENTIQKIVNELQEVHTTPSAKKVDIPGYVLGDFREYPTTDEKKIILPSHLTREINTQVEHFSAKRKFSLPSLLIGDNTAGNYDIRTANFSTRTSIQSLSSGERIFTVFAPLSSQVHRGLDSFSKKQSGKPMRKASRDEWKSAFEEKSRIPTISNSHPHTVTLPFISNVNAYDAIANNHEIDDFGEHSWAKDLDYDGKMEVLQHILDEVGDIHKEGIGWGEVILPNVILTDNKRAIMVDPEIRYNTNVSRTEQQAHDVHDLILSFCGALYKSENTQDYSDIIREVFAKHPDSAVIEEVQKQASKQPNIIEGAFRRFYETARLGISVPEMEKVNASISKIS